MIALGRLAEIVGGKVVGDSETPIRGVRPFGEAREGDITLASDRKLLDRLESTAASAVIVEMGRLSKTKPLLQVAQPKVAFAKILQHIHGVEFHADGVSERASIGEGCRIADSVTIEPFVHVGRNVAIGERVTLRSGVSVGDGCRIGHDCTLHPNVVLYAGVELGNGVVIHGGTVIGADGFGYVFDGNRQVKILQTGNVVIHDDVEIGANSCVDRATFGSTVIEKGVKLDNHVHIGHNCRIGENTIIVGCVGVSGSCRIGRNCVLAGQSGVVDHVKIGDGVTVMVKTAVTRDVPDGSVISGQPGRNHREQLRILALTQKLPEMFKDLKELKKALRGGRFAE